MPAITQLRRLQSRLSRLQGIDNDILKAAGFDDILAELDTITDSVEQLRDVMADLAGLDDALRILLLLLHRAEDEPLGAMGLKYLLEPLCGGLSKQTEKLGELI
ncbi:hypothetical protein LH460_06295 [Laribacter hongkongensis]|uniref:Uncharacterized protein n=1 Tax=Laribacter hongkongensis (strain HLHK9) TaxID=557598 RepID=C1D727_LARHH|nr:hypothetical protein [Laribacter hongkongensis]ACO74267.1 hypothetical protein LHK_01277 [Laribacter hongkongensis HLHK9]MCG9124281.1 hypothetical protein [Laribacter hongkongensis]